jgi:hypothetical protein
VAGRPATLVIDIITEATRAIAGIKDVGDTATKQESKFKRLGKVVAGAFAVGAVVAFGKEAVTAASDDAAAQAQLARALKNTTGATDAQIAASEKYIDNLSKQSATADDELRPALATLARAFGDTETAQKNLGLATDIAAATGKPLETVVNAMAKAAQGSTAPLGKLVGKTKDAAGAALSLDEIMRIAAERMEGDAAAAAETTAGKMEGAQIAMDELTEQVGTALLPTIGQLATILADKVVPALSAVFTFISNNIGWLAPLAAGILAVVAAMKLWNIIQATFNITLAANPIGLVVTAIGVLITVATLVIMNWDKVVAFFGKAWETIKRGFTAVGKVFSRIWDGIKKAAAAVIDWLRRNWPTILAILTGPIGLVTLLITKNWDKIKQAAVTATNWIREKWQAVVSWFSGFPGKIMTYLGNLVSRISNWIGSTWTNLWNSLKDTALEVWNSISDALGDIWSGITGTISSAWSGVVSTVKGAINTIIGGVNTVIGAINSAINVVNKLPGPNIPNIPTIPKLAQGGIVTRPTLAFLAEKGPEAVVPLGRRGAGGVGGNYTLNINTKRADPADVAWGFRRLELARGFR